MRNAKSTLLNRWFDEVWNNGNKDALDELLAEDVIAHGLYPEGHPQGIASFKLFYDDFRSQLGNIHVTVEDVIAQDDIESALCNVTATHIPSGKQVSFGGSCYAKIKDGKIVQAWNNFDFLKMYQQIGLELTQSKA
jgi:predicted ester cyclase